MPVPTTDRLCSSDQGDICQTAGPCATKTGLWVCQSSVWHLPPLPGCMIVIDRRLETSSVCSKAAAKSM